MRPYRKEKIASVVREIVSEAIARRINDPRLAPLTTVSRVEMNGDLTLAKVFLTVCGDAATERRTIAAMRHAAGYVQRMVAHELSIRQCPELRFELDETARRVRETMQLLAENQRNRGEAVDPAVDVEPSLDPDDDAEEVGE